MSDTTTTRLGLTKPETGASSGTWGSKTNTNWDTVDEAIFDAQTDATEALADAAAAQSTANTGVANALTANTAVNLLTPRVTQLNFGTNVSGAQNLSMASSGVFDGSVDGVTVFTFTNVTAGFHEVYVLAFITSGSVAFTNATWPSGGDRDLPNQAIGVTNLFRLTTLNGGTNWFGEFVGPV